MTRVLDLDSATLVRPSDFVLIGQIDNDATRHTRKASPLQLLQAGGGAAVSNNLADLDNKSLALINLGGAPLSSPGFLGIPTAPTPANNINSNQLATTAFVRNYLSSLSLVNTINGQSGTVTVTLTGLGGLARTNNLSDLSNPSAALANLAAAPIASPNFSGTPTTPTAAPGTNTTQIASTAFVRAAILAGGGGGGGAVSSIIGLTGTISLAQLVTAGVAPINSPTFTGTPTATNPAGGDNSTRVATTAFVQSSIGGGGVSGASGLPYTLRQPNGSDLLGYTVGQLWLDGNQKLWQFDSANNNKANWVPYPSVGEEFADIISTAVAIFSNRRRKPGYTGHLFTVLRMTDLTTMDIDALPNGKPNLVPLISFLANTQGRGYISKIYNQDGSGNDAAQTVIASMPAIDLHDTLDGYIPFRFDFAYRQFWAGMGAYTINWTSGTTMTVTGGTVGPSGPTITGPNDTAMHAKYTILPGTSVQDTASRFPAGTTVVSFNYGNNTLVTSAAPSVAPGTTSFNNVNVTSPPVGLDLPNGLTVPWRNWGFIMAMQPGLGGGSHRLLNMGVHGTDALNNTLNFDGIQTRGLTNTGFRILSGNNQGGSNGFGTLMSSARQIFGFSRSGTTGNTITYTYNNNVFATGSIGGGTSYLAVNLTGGTIGAGLQFTSSIAGDFLMWDLIISNAAISQTDMTKMSAGVYATYKWRPQIVDYLIADGSSTTQGNGTTAALSWPHHVCEHLKDIYPIIPFNAAAGGSIEYSASLVSLNAVMAPINSGNGYRNKGLVVFHPGMGNSIQATGSASVTATDQVNGILTLNVNPQAAAPSFAPGFHVNGSNIPANALITANTTTTITISPPPTGSANGAITVAAEQGNWAFQAIRLYVGNVVGLGYPGVLIIGSANRRTFALVSAQEVIEFSTLKTLTREKVTTISGVVGFIDWEDYAYFGDDGPMTVTNISGNNITVAAKTSNALVGNRIRWSGMPCDETANTGHQQIQAVSGNVITVSDATGITVSGIIRAINPTPWLTYPAYWGDDGQHFSPLGYEFQASIIAQKLLENPSWLRAGLV